MSRSTDDLISIKSISTLSDEEKKFTLIKILGVVEASMKYDDVCAGVILKILNDAIDESEGE